MQRINEWMNEWMKKWKLRRISFKPLFLLSLLTNKDTYNTQIIQCVNDTIFRKRFRVPGFGTGSGTLEPVPWNRFLRQITTTYRDSKEQYNADCVSTVNSTQRVLTDAGVSTSLWVALWYLYIYIYIYIYIYTFQLLRSLIYHQFRW